jgi:hypothetical protein
LESSFQNRVSDDGNPQSTSKNPENPGFFAPMAPCSTPDASVAELVHELRDAI